MLRSMTGFGAATARAGGEEVTVEVRAVNGKFCEVKARLPREFAALEPLVLRRVKERLARGGVDVTVRRGEGEAGPRWPKVDAVLAQRYLERFENAVRGEQQQQHRRDLQFPPQRQVSLDKANQVRREVIVQRQENRVHRRRPVQHVPAERKHHNQERVERQQHARRDGQRVHVCLRFRKKPERRLPARVQSLPGCLHSAIGHLADIEPA
jgi:hypothetical protein